MKEIILCKFGEIALKGLNKSNFESTLVKNVRRRLKSIGNFELEKAQSTLYVTPADENADIDLALDSLKKVFGIVKLYKALELDKSMDAILNDSLDYLSDALSDASTFKVTAKRADKRFGVTSPQICIDLGEKILQTFPHLSVDVHEPDVTVSVEIREKSAFVNAMRFDGAGGLPVGTGGRALLLLSGGIDSPVAGYMMAKRGVHIQAVHFEAPPYTSERARLKVEKLAEKISLYCGDIYFYCVPFTEIQLAIRDNCPNELFTVIMRRLMMEITQRIAEEQDCSAIITGESLGQVASQTMGAVVCTDAACRMPVFRPCIGLDKSEIVKIANHIDTFDTSVLPYEDCCTVFTPKHPKTRPTVAEVEAAQNAFDFEPLIVKAMENISGKMIRCGENNVNL